MGLQDREWMRRDSLADSSGELKVAGGRWAPPRRWKSRLYRVFGLVAPDRWIPEKK